MVVICLRTKCHVRSSNRSLVQTEKYRPFLHGLHVVLQSTKNSPEETAYISQICYRTIITPLPQIKAALVARISQVVESATLLLLTVRIAFYGSWFVFSGITFLPRFVKVG
jgi:hypothetical protein